MPTNRTKGVKGVYVELPPEVLDEAKQFAETRGETFREVVTQALRRHLAYPPPPPPPPAPPLPFPPPASSANLRGGTKKQRKE